MYNKMNRQNESLQIGQSLPYKEASNSDVQEGIGESTSHAPMRTGFGVNLDRTQSNGTDKVSSSDEVMIQIPLRPLLPNKCVSTKGKPKASTSLSGQALSMGDIHRYFKPTNQDDFEIATDDTATETNQSTAPPSPQPMSSERIGVRRLPLQPVREGRLNILNNENGDNSRLDHDNEVHSPPILSPIAGRRMGSRQHLNPVRGIARTETMSRSQPPRHAQTISPPGHLPISTPLRQVSNAMDTPPASIDFVNAFLDERYRGIDHSSSPRRGRRLAPRVRRSPTATRRRTMHPDETSGTISSTREQRETSSGMPGSRRILPLPDSPYYNLDHSIGASPSLFVCDTSAPGPSASHPYYLSALHQHQAVEEELGKLLPRIEVSVARPGSTMPRQVVGEGIAGISSSKRQCRRRTSSTSNNLPLERIPRAYETHSLLSVVEASSTFKSTIAKNLIFDDLKLQRLEFRNAHESLSVERRLMAAVDIWKEGQTGDIEIEYTLRSHIKGKGTM